MDRIEDNYQSKPRIYCLRINVKLIMKLTKCWYGHFVYKYETIFRLEMARKEPIVARTRLLDDNATIGPMINAALRKIDALENEVRF